MLSSSISIYIWVRFIGFICSSAVRVDATGSDDETLAKTFKNKLRPSCESFDPKGYFGQEDENGSPQYSVTDDLSKDMFSNFYWDDVHPTHTGWFIAMMQLEEEAKAFLDLKN
jgi:hypothetical protein